MLITTGKDLNISKLSFYIKAIVKLECRLSRLSFSGRLVSTAPPGNQPTTIAKLFNCSYFMLNKKQF